MGRFSGRRHSNDARGHGSHGTSPKPVCMRRQMHYQHPSNVPYSHLRDRLNRVPELYSVNVPYNWRNN